MTEQQRGGLGELVKTARKMRGLSAAQLGHRVKISASYVQKIESGRRKPPMRLVLDLAHALDVGVEVLTGQPYYGDAEGQERVHAVVPELRRILLTYDAPDDVEIAPRGLPALVSAVDQISALRRDARYGPMGAVLPPVLTELTHVALSDRAYVPGTTWSARDRQTAFFHLARAYRAVNSLAHKMGHVDLSNTALERVRWAAEQSGDPLMQVTAGYLVAGAMLRQGAFASARRKLLGLRAELERQQPEEAYSLDALAVDGALVLKLAVIAARRNAPDAARDWLEEARQVAAAMGNVDSLAYETSFGPTNIRIHEFHTLVDVCATDEALARVRAWGRGEEWAPPAGTVGERASHHYIDLAHAKVAESDRAGAFEALRTARRIAPNHTRFHPSARETAGVLLRTDRHPSDALLQFATWTGIHSR